MIIITPSDPKKYSIDNYDILRPSDFANILTAFKDQHSCRLRIMRFLAKVAKEEKNAKTTKQIAKELNDISKPHGVSEPAALKHLDALKDIGVIVQTRSEDEDNNGRGPREVNIILMIKNSSRYLRY